ncbi:MAG: TolC family protein [Polyangiaceae bacterium]
MAVTIATSTPAAARAEGAPSTSTTPLRASDVIATAVEWLPSIAGGGAEIDQAEGELLSAEGAFDPTFRATGNFTPQSGYPSWQVNTVIEQPTPLWGASLFAGYRVGLGDYPVYDEKLATNQYGEIRAGLRVPLLRDGPIDRRRASIDRAELGVDVAKLGLEQQILEASRLAGLRYWDWAAAGERANLVADWVDVAERRDQQLRSRAEAGDAPDIDVVENERSLLQRRAQSIQATRSLEQAAIDLSIYYRRSTGPVVPVREQLPGALPSPAPPSSKPLAVDDALAARPEVKRLYAQRGQAEIELDLAINQSWPALDITAATSADFGPEDNKRAVPVFEVGVVLEVPFIQRREQGRIAAQRSAMRRVDQQALTQADRIAAEVRDAESAIARAYERFQLLEREVALAVQLEEAERRRFELGETTLLFVNTREQSTVEARLRLVDAKLDYQRALVQLRFAMGER